MPGDAGEDSGKQTRVLYAAPHQRARTIAVIRERIDQRYVAHPKYLRKRLSLYSPRDGRMLNVTAFLSTGFSAFPIPRSALIKALVKVGLPWCHFPRVSDAQDWVSSR
jgi:hypothetical protein